MTHDEMCDVSRRHTRITFTRVEVGECDCDLIARVRAHAMEMEARRALKARDRCRLNSDAWSRLDRFACDMFEDARAIRGDE
jgi:hypothetical protein